MNSALKVNPRLKVLELAISNICNMHPLCVTCFPQRNMLTSEEKALADNRVVDKVIEYIPRIDRLFLTGLGEPAVHPLFWKLLNSAKGKVAFLTNGLFLNEAMSGVILDNVLGITVSLDAASPKIYELMRKDQDSFVAIIKNLKYIIRLRKNKKTPVVNLSFVISKANVDELYDFAVLASDIGADSVYFTTLNSTFRENYTILKNGYHWDYQQEIISEEDRALRNNINPVLRFAKRTGITLKTSFGYNYISDNYIDFLSIPAPNYSFAKNTCNRPWTTFFIKPNGDITLCCFNYPQTIGNILNDNLEDLILHSETLNVIRKKLTNRELPLYCKDCCWIPNSIKFNDFDYAFERDSLKFIRQDKFFILRGSIRNTGRRAWINTESRNEEYYKIGARVFELNNEEVSLIELRNSFNKNVISPGDCCEFEFKIDKYNLSAVSYLLKVDIVKEHSFWFEDLGVKPLKINFDFYSSENHKFYEIREKDGVDVIVPHV